MQVLLQAQKLHVYRSGTFGAFWRQTEGRRDGRTDRGTEGWRDGGTEGRRERERDGEQNVYITYTNKAKPGYISLGRGGP